MLTPSQNQRLSSKSSDDCLKVMLFSISRDPESVPENLFALPLEAIVKIMPCPDQLGSFKRGVSIVELEGRTVTVIDLCYRLAPERPANVLDRKFLMLVQTHSEDLCAIPVANFPELIELPVTSVRPIPAVYRQVNDIRFASHMASVERISGRPPERVLLMGMNHLLVEKLSMMVDQHNTPALNAALN
jgi:chemotaxis signal transduction protein